MIGYIQFILQNFLSTIIGLFQTFVSNDLSLKLMSSALILYVFQCFFLSGFTSLPLNGKSSLNQQSLVIEILYIYSRCSQLNYLWINTLHSHSDYQGFRNFCSFSRLLIIQETFQFPSLCATFPWKSFISYCLLKFCSSLYYYSLLLTISCPISNRSFFFLSPFNWRVGKRAVPLAGFNSAFRWIDIFSFIYRT